MHIDRYMDRSNTTEKVARKSDSTNNFQIFNRRRLEQTPACYTLFATSSLRESGFSLHASEFSVLGRSLQSCSAVDYAIALVLAEVYYMFILEWRNCTALDMCVHKHTRPTIVGRPREALKEKNFAKRRARKSHYSAALSSARVIRDR